jgi:hypothetical protein
LFNLILMCFLSSTKTWFITSIARLKFVTFFSFIFSFFLISLPTDRVGCVSRISAISQRYALLQWLFYVPRCAHKCSKYYALTSRYESG